MDALENLIESVRDGKADMVCVMLVCIVKVTIACSIICTDEARTGKPLLLPKSLKE